MKSTLEIIARAREMGIGLPAFNIPYLPMVEPIVRAIVDQDSFALVEVARIEWTKFEAGSIPQAKQEFDRWAHPGHVRLHLDHVPVIDEDGKRVDWKTDIGTALSLGYSSVMIDGSRLDFEANIAATREVAGMAHAAGAACEAELGSILGYEEKTLLPYAELFASGWGFTRVDEAALFVRETGCDWLSVAVGNVHGAIAAGLRDAKKVEARLSLDRLAALSEATGVPLVLHGGTGVRHEDLLAGMQRGIAKINVATDIRQAFELGLRSGGSETAQQATYERTVKVIRDSFGVAGIARRILA
jgi:fructose-bisphosphate aldolase class II